MPHELTGTGNPTAPVEAIHEAVARAYTFSAHLRARLSAAGITPTMVRAGVEFGRLPFTTKADLREIPLLEYAAVPARSIRRVHASSGTTGTRTVIAYTRRDIDDWMEMFVRCYRYAGVDATDRIQIAVGYGLWTAGVGFQEAAERLGATAVPTGPGNTDLQLEMALGLRSTVLCATSSFALLLAELIERRSLVAQLALRTGIFGSERWGEALRRRIESLLRVRTFDLYGLTELWGPGAGVECVRQDGIHVWTDHYYLEIIDPVTLQPVPAGTPGEIVVTTLTKQATPLLRYRTGDLSYLYPQPCACGSPFPRIGRIRGRLDDQLKIRGVLILPTLIDGVLSAVEGAGPEYQVHVDRDGHGRETIILRVEAEGRPDLGTELAERLNQSFGIRFDVEIVPPDSLPRSDRKTRRVFDHREP
jgi:phenylacetate-CoA ligase